jgi:hypothetical protein
VWSKPWKFAEGITIGAGLILVGLMLQVTIGSIDWRLLAHPLNVILLGIYVLVLGILYAVRKHVYVVEWTMTVYAAVPALAYGVLITLLMGLFDWDQMLRSWPFTLVYIWLMNILGLISIRRILHLSRGGKVRNLCFICNHLGFFMAMVCGTLGYADMQKYRLTAKVDQPEWRAIDLVGTQMPPKVVELPLAIELHDFTIDEYPPKYVVIDNETGMIVADSPWRIQQDSIWEYAAIVYGRKDSLGNQDMDRYVEWPSMGACTAGFITATRYASAEEAANGQGTALDTKQGWVSCGSFMFPYKALCLDSLYSAVMPDREPKRYASDVTVYTANDQKVDGIIEVNKPLEIKGWKIYQVSYDQAMGRWSDTSVFEIVRDPWLPWVYAGIYMMLAGAVLTFITAGYNKK